MLSMPSTISSTESVARLIQACGSVRSSSMRCIPRQRRHQSARRGEAAGIVQA